EGVVAEQRAAAVGRIHGGTETVLVAEDEDGVRALAQAALQTLGYTVLLARDGDEAVQSFTAVEGKGELLITDVGLARISGRQLADLLLASQSQLKVLFISGYTDDAVVRHGLLQAGVAFLQKPFTPSVLARKVRQVLDQP